MLLLGVFRVASSIRKEWRYIFASGFIIILSVTSMIAGRSMLTILNPVTILTRKADVEAIQWLDANLPETGCNAGKSIFMGLWTIRR